MKFGMRKTADMDSPVGSNAFRAQHDRRMTLVALSVVGVLNFVFVCAPRSAFADARSSSLTLTANSQTPSGSRASGGFETGAAELLPPIRRLGLRPVTTNVAELRTYLSKESSGDLAPGGFASLPLSAEQASERLQEMLEHALDTSGRYFHVSSGATAHGDGASVLLRGGSGGGEWERRLEEDYDLDAWLQADVFFAPDQARVQLTLHTGTRKGVRLLAREDVLLRPDATEKDLHEAFLVALGRVSSTLGHDGRVTSMRDELVTLDFGKERGLLAGSRVELGLVVLAAAHPASGETLRSRRVTTHAVEVLDAREGTSIARIVRLNPLVVRKAAELFSRGHADDLPLLAWRQVAPPVLTSRGKNPWEQPRQVEVEPLTGAVSQGYAYEKAHGTEGSLPSQDSQDAGFLGALFGVPSSRKARTEHTATADAKGTAHADRQTGADATSEEFDEVEGEERLPQVPRPSPRGRSRPARDDVAFLSARAGLGTTFGILETDRGDRYSDFPATVLNTLRAQVHLGLPSEWESKPEVALRLYSGGDVEGSQFILAAPLLKPAVQTQQGRLLLGGELHIGGGQVKTIRVQESLSHFALLGVAEYEAHFSGLGAADVGGGLSLFGLFGGHLEGYLSVSVSPSAFLPKPLGLHVRLEAGPEKWTAIEFGASWAFHQAKGR